MKHREQVHGPKLLRDGAGKKLTGTYPSSLLKGFVFLPLCPRHPDDLQQNLKLQVGSGNA